MDCCDFPLVSVLQPKSDVILILFSSLFLELQLDVCLRDLFQSSSQVLQHFCVEQFSGENLRPLAGALVCGNDLSGSPLKNLFIDTGLYHVLVVSGAHLGLLLFFFNSLWLSQKPESDQIQHSSLRRWVISGCLFFYALMTGLQAPVVRALFQYLMMRDGRVRPIDVLFSYFYCLAFEPRWLNSLSLQLSTVATLAFIFPFSTFKKNVLIFCAILPLLLPLGIRSPLVTIVATLFSPLLELLMMPAFALAMVLQPLQPLLEIGLTPLLAVLQNIRQSLPPPTFSNFHLSPLVAHLYVVSLWLVCEFWVSHSRRAWHFRRSS